MTAKYIIFTSINADYPINKPFIIQRKLDQINKDFNKAFTWGFDCKVYLKGNTLILETSDETHTRKIKTLLESIYIATKDYTLYFDGFRKIA